MPSQSQKHPSPKSESRPRRLSETIGLVLLLLAIPTPQQSTTSVPDNVGACFNNGAKPTFLHYAASMLQDGPSESSLKVLLRDEDEEDETISNSDSTNGESLEVSSHSGSVHSDASPIVLGYVALKQLTALKHDKIALNAVLRATTTPTAERNSGVASSTASLAVPGHAVFIKMPNFALEDPKLTLRSSSLNEAQLKDLTQWKCSTCNYRNPQGQQFCMNNQCQAPCDATQKSLRAFFGQLRKEQSVEFVQWLTSTLTPNAELLHIENHTNVKTGRGKGCAWVYTNSRESLDELLTLHKRVFVDIVDGEEGIWLVPEDQDSLFALSEYVGAQERDAEQSKILPKQALVIETPKERNMPTRPRESSVTNGPYSSPYEQNAFTYADYYGEGNNSAQYYCSAPSTTCPCASCAYSTYSNGYSSNYDAYYGASNYAQYNNYYACPQQCGCVGCTSGNQFSQQQYPAVQQQQHGSVYQHNPYGNGVSYIA